MAKIFVGNLSFDTSDDEVRELFAEHGDVQSVELVTDRDTGRPRGFGFVQMDEEGAAKAISALDGREVHGRNLRVDMAKDRPRSRQPRYQGVGW
jgi:RNA recognition motif-containing protein